MADQVDSRWTWPQVQRLRDTLEKAQRAETAQTHEDHEACYPVFMERVLRTIFKDRYQPALLEQVSAYELQVENAI